MAPAEAGVIALTRQDMTHMWRPPVGEAVDTPMTVGALRQEQALPTALPV